MAAITKAIESVPVSGSGQPLASSESNREYAESPFSPSTDEDEAEISGPEIDQVDPALWEVYKDVIYDLYIRNRNTLEATRNIMKARHNFSATARKYKARFRKWDWPPKKLTNEIYNALDLMEERLLSTYSVPTTLIVYTGMGDRVSETRKIKKQLKRPVKGASNGWKAMTLDEATSILSRYTHLQARVSIDGQVVDLQQLLDPSSLVSQSLQHLLLPTASPAFGLPNSESSAPELEHLHRSPDPTALPPSLKHDIHSSYQMMGRVHHVLCLKCPPSSAHRDLDCDREFELSLANPPFHHTTITNKDHDKAIVTDWYVPYVVQCLVQDAVGNTSMTNALSDNKLLHVIKVSENNEYLLPALNWTICVLTFNHRTAQLRSLVERSTDLIEKSAAANSILRLPFQLVRAHLRKDMIEVQAVGEQFTHAYSQVRGIYKAAHPNAIVYFYHWCWYAFWYQQSYKSVRKQLESALPMLERLLGRHCTLTLNCMVMLGRCYIELQQYHEARSILYRAHDQMGIPPNHLRAYHAHILVILARAETEAGQWVDAKRHLEDALREQLDIFGVASSNKEAFNKVWKTIFELKEVMYLLGQKEQADLWVREYSETLELVRHEWDERQDEIQREQWQQSEHEIPSSRA